MIKKIKGIFNIAKTRAILLLEACFIGVDKIICNSRVLLRLEVHRAIPHEVIGGRRGKYSQHVALNKNLVCSIGNQTMIIITMIE